jgi:hypothetical protein
MVAPLFLSKLGQGADIGSYGFDGHEEPPPAWSTSVYVRFPAASSGAKKSLK